MRASINRQSSFLRLTAFFVSAAASLVCLTACAKHLPDRQNDTAVEMPDRYPEGLIQGNYHDSSYALHVFVRQVAIDEERSIRGDDGKTGYAALVFDCEVICSYKGELRGGDEISFVALWEYYEGLIEELNFQVENRIVFINKDKEGLYYALNFGVFLFANDLDRALRALAETNP